MPSLVRFIKRNDVKIYYLFNKKMNCQPLSFILRRITELFDPGATTVLLVMALIISQFANSDVGIHIGVVLLISQVIVHTIKRIINRRRPFETLPDVLFNLIPPKDIYSFPSGHTCAAFAFMFVLSFYFPGLSKVFFMFGVTVGISRIYLGFHYPTDVFVGAIIPYLVYIFTVGFFI